MTDLTDQDIPAKALAAACRVIEKLYREHTTHQSALNLAKFVLMDAAPLIAAAERERIRHLADRAGAIYPLPFPYPAITVNGEPVGDTLGNVVLWPDGMPATAPFADTLAARPPSKD